MLKNRWAILIAGMLMNFTMSFTYSWSVFSTPLMELFGWTAAATAVTFTLTGVMGPFSQILGGGLLNRFGVKRTMLVSIIVFSLSMFAAGYTNSIGWLYLTYGGICAFSMSVIYICNLSNILRFFDDRRGTASGVLTAGAGLSAITTAPIAQHLIASYGVLNSFKIFGAAYLLVLMILFILIREAPAPSQERPKDEEAVTSNEKLTIQRSFSPLEMLKTPSFYLLLSLYAIGATGGLMVIGQTANMALEILNAKAATAALAVSAVALGNALGRILWGLVSDKFGRYETLPFIYIFMTVLLVAFNLCCRSSLALFMLVLILIGLCFGGVASMFPAFTLDVFGPKYNGMNYGFMFFGYAIGAFLGPVIAANYKDAGAAPFSAGLLIATIICAVGILLAFILKTKHYKSDRA